MKKSACDVTLLAFQSKQNLQDEHKSYRSPLNYWCICLKEINSFELLITLCTELCFKLLYKSIWIPNAFEGLSAGNHMVIVLVNDQPSIDVFQSCNFQFHCFPIFISRFASCGFAPTGIVSFACG
jgi:hypothetical protein